MANDIKQKIVLEGEKEYNRALSEAKRNLKTLRSELKAETAELGANATAQQKNETKIKSLQKQIKEQEKIVKTYRDALKEVKEKYSDNEDAIAKWEQKLNEARATLGGMRNELENVGKGFDGIQRNADMATVATKSVADAFGQIGAIGGTISDTIESIFRGLLNTMSSAITEVWSMIADTAAKANNWTDLASYYGTTASEIEKISKAVEWSQGNFQDFTNLLNQLSWGGKEKKITEWFNVSDVNYENKLEYAMAVLEKMNEMQRSDPKKLGDAMEDIFGAKKSQQIMWFVNNLESVQKNLQQIEEKGYDLGDDNLQTMNEVWLTLGEIEGKWNSLKQKFAAGFGKITLDFGAEASRGLDALAKYFNAETPEEQEAAMHELEESIVGMFEVAEKAIRQGIGLLDKMAEDLKASDNPTAQAIGNILSGLVDALKWLTEDNMRNVVSALEILAAFWIVGNGAKMAANLTSVAANLKTIKMFNTGGMGSTGLTGFGLSGSAGLAVSDVTAAINASAGPIASAIARLTMSVGVVTLAVPVVSALADIIKGQWPSWLPNPNDTPGDFLPEGTAEEVKEVFEQLLNDPVLKKQGGNKSIRDLLSGGTADDTKYVETTGVAIPVIRLPNGGKRYAINANEEQQAAANSWWDAYRSDSGLSDAHTRYQEMEEAFKGNEEAMLQLLALIDQLEKHQKDNEFSNLEDLPEDWWVGGGKENGLTSEDISGFKTIPGQMRAAVREGVSGIKVSLDGYRVGELVAPYVSEMIARSIV